MSIETMTKIATYTVGAGGVASYTFSNIPQTYTDLMLKVSLRCSASGPFNAVYMQVNGDTSASYSTQRMWSYGGTTAVAAINTTLINLNWTSGNTATANTFGSGEIYFYNYTDNLTKNIATELLSQNSSASEVVTGVGNGLWNNTSPITSITIIGETNFMQHSTLTLYGVKALRTAVGNSIKATGGTLAFDGTYYYHTFSSSAILDVKQPLTNVDFLVVAGGGGGGGGSSGGGGGAGGFRTSAGTSGRGASAESKLTLAPGSYPVVVGGGAAQGGNGTNSSFYTVVSLGGGGNGVNGGSGGGQSSGGGPAGNYPRGLGTTGQGYDGGAHLQSTYYPAGGGGGAGANGANATSAPSSGNGGIGVASSITGVNTYYAGGGGGGGQFSGTAGTGGLGGGGAGSVTVNGSNGSGGTGGGGGGAGYDGTGRSGGSGGSGIVVIRYAK